MSLELEGTGVPAEPPMETSPHARGLRVWPLVQIGFTTFAASGMWWLVQSRVGAPNHWLHSLFLPALIVLLIGLFVLREESHWWRPSRELRRLINGARAGDIPIEELSRIRGGLKPLVSVLRDLLHDLRSQKAVVAEIQAETRQRIASRTDALERQIGSLRQQASRDGMTGLLNRRMFDDNLPKLVEHCATDHLELSVLVIDVDNFKVLNDTLGHPAGDKLLRDIGQIIRSGVRDHELAFRVGGDEFVLILPGANAEQAAGLGRRLIELVDALAKPLKLAKLPRLSIGIASLSEVPNANPQELVNRADRRLYETKSSRRARAVAPTLKRSA